MSYFTASSSISGSAQADDGALLLMKLNSAINTCRMHGEEESPQTRFAVLTGVVRPSRASSLGRGAGPGVIPLPLTSNTKLLEFATAEAESWGMSLINSQAEGGGIELVLKSPSDGCAVLAGNVWGEPVVGATAAALEEPASTLFPLNCAAKLGLDKVTCDQLCIQVPAGSPLFYARQNQERVVRLPNAKLNISKLGVVSLVALESPIPAGTALSVAPPIVAILSRATGPAAVEAAEFVAGGAEFEPDPFTVHLQMYKVSLVVNPAFLVFLCIHTSKFCPVSSLLAYRLLMWDPMLLVKNVCPPKLCCVGLPTHRRQFWHSRARRTRMRLRNAKYRFHWKISRCSSPLVPVA